MKKIKVKKLYVDTGQYLEMESVTRFLDNVEYITEEPEKEEFWYEVAFYGNNIKDFWTYQNKQTGFKTKDIFPYLLKKQARLAVCYMREYPFEHNDWVQMQSKIGLDAWSKFGVDPDQIYYFYGNAPQELDSIKKRNVNVIEVPYFEMDFVHRVNKGEIDYVTPYEAGRKNPSRTFLDLNGKPIKFNRLRHVVHLWNRRLIDQGIINLFETDEDKRLYKKYDYYQKVKDIIQGKDWDKLFDWWPQSHDNTVGLYGKHHSGYPYDKKLFEDTFMSLVAETHCGHSSCNPQFFISEKIVKAIGNAHPFVVLSTQGFLEELKARGYKTFAPYINEEYDNEPDTELRMVKAIDQIAHLSKNGVPVKALEIAIKNQEKLFKKHGTWIRKLKKIMRTKKYDPR